MDLVLQVVGKAIRLTVIAAVCLPGFSWAADSSAHVRPSEKILLGTAVPQGGRGGALPRAVSFHQLATEASKLRRVDSVYAARPGDYALFQAAATALFRGTASCARTGAVDPKGPIRASRGNGVVTVVNSKPHPGEIKVAAFGVPQPGDTDQRSLTLVRVEQQP